MASTQNFHQPPPQPPKHGHQRSKSNVLKSFMHRRNNSDGTNLPSEDLQASAYPQVANRPSVDEMRMPNFSRHPSTLGEIQNTRVDGTLSRSPSKQYEQQIGGCSGRLSPTKTFNTISLKAVAAKDERSIQEGKQKENNSPTKPKKTKSTTNLAGLLSRPKSLKNLHKLVSEDDVPSRKDQENRTPPSSMSTPQEEQRPPIYAHFSSGALESQNSLNVFDSRVNNGSSSGGSNASSRKQRPQSYHAQYAAAKHDGSSAKLSPSKTQRGLKAFTRGLVGSRTEASTAESSGQVVDPTALDPKDVDKHLEAMLNRRNIPENQRYKMRNLADTIKMEFIRQDWAESHMALNRPGTNDSDTSLNEGQERERGRPKKSRGMSFTISRNSGKKSEPNSPTKKQKGDGTIGRHFRSKSTDSVASERPSSSGSGSGNGILSKIKLQQGPADFVTYLRKVQKPELVEVGKLHKLRLLLRNETVAWTDEFVRQGGMEEIVGLLHRIMEVEWREEHEDALLHENLLCLKALCTTGLALQYLHSIQGTLFPALLRMVFDPEKKGPSEFTTRGIITSVLFTYIQTAPPEDRVVRARTVLGHLRDPEPKEEERPLPFVLEMRRERPYRVWCKEAVGVTKEVFWIFLHHLNVVYMSRDQEHGGVATTPRDGLSYLHAHFPQERPPVPAAPYVGGVEWDATNYLASHLDLVNAVIACTPTVEERNNLRELLRISGWERCMGGSIRLCKEKFYPGVHDALRTWVAAAAEDDWGVRDVRYGPPAEARSPIKSGGMRAKKKAAEPPPKIEMPKLDFALDSHAAGNYENHDSENWLS
ncbi:armadillo-type protein [Xylariales sp. AK1849]|nr:armadillo-type protein [Xylariales sp. AK1849]